MSRGLLTLKPVQTFGWVNVKPGTRWTGTGLSDYQLSAMCGGHGPTSQCHHAATDKDQPNSLHG